MTIPRRQVLLLGGIGAAVRQLPCGCPGET